MKIDLHCHTKKIKSGETDKRNVSLEVFKEKISNSDVKIVAITNHNCFDLHQYKEFCDSVLNHCMVWPGIELDIVNSGNRWHLIVVANPEHAEVFSNTIENLLLNKNTENCCFTIEDVVDSVSKHDVIYIPHFHKNPAIPEDDRQNLIELVKEEWRVFNETSDLRTMGVFANHDYRVIVGSDVQDWSQYEQSSFANLRLPVSSFTQFILLAKKDRNVVETILSEKNPRKVKVSPHKSVSFELGIYEEINVIFGAKGTGKSEILRTMRDSLENQGLACVYYNAPDNETEFEKIIRISDVERDVTKVQAAICTSDFDSIFGWGEKKPTPLTMYTKWIQTRDNNTNKARMKITNATHLIPPQDEMLKKTQEDYLSISQVFDKLSSINPKDYVADDDMESLYRILNNLRATIKRQVIRKFIEISSINLANYSIDKIKEIADRNSETVSKPSTTGFFEFAINRFELKSLSNTIIENLSKESHSDLEYLGILEDKGRVHVQTSYRMITDSKARTEGFKDKNIRKLKSVYEVLKRINKEFCETDINSLVNEFTRNCKENSIEDTSNFLSISKYIVNENGDEYLPSSGEKGILLLQKVLDKDVPAYILDEPELGMGSAYIEQTIRPKLNDLAKSNKIVVVATHNANIAVRSMPCMSILRTHDNGKYGTYVGNPFIDILENIDDPNDSRNWREESLHTLEGGEEAFYERKYVYESGNNKSKIS